MTNHPDHQITAPAKAAHSYENEAGSLTAELMRLILDERAHNCDGPLLHGRDGAQPVTAFIRRRVADN